jgi:hypothetical protein
MFTASTGAFVLAVLKALPALISLIAAIKQSADAATSRGLGYDEAVNATLKAVADHVAAAHEVEMQADQDHTAKKDDTAFDGDFQRKD